VDERTLTAVVGTEPSDEPFSFGTYVAIESARAVFGAVRVHAVHLPYGFWWDTLRPSVELVRTGEAGVDPLPLGGVWTTTEDFVVETDPCFDGAAAAYRRPLLEL
jgi:hypothetical protein